MAEARGKSYVQVLGLRIHSAKHIVLRFSGKRPQQEKVKHFRRSRFTIYLKNDEASFNENDALLFSFSPGKYQILTLDADKYTRDPRKLINNQRSHVGSIDLNVQFLLDSPLCPQWYPLNSLEGYILLNYVPEINNPKFGVHLASARLSHRSSLSRIRVEDEDESLARNAVDYDFLGFPVPDLWSDIYNCERNFHLMIACNGRIYVEHGGGRVFKQLNNIQIMKSPFVHVFWRGIPEKLRHTFYEVLSRVQIKNSQWGERYYLDLCKRALEDRTQLMTDAMYSTSHSNAVRSQSVIDTQYISPILPPKAKSAEALLNVSIHSSDDGSEPEGAEKASPQEQTLAMITAQIDDIISKGVSFVDGPIIMQIERDLHRTFSNGKNRFSNSRGQEQLRRVLLAFSYHNRNTGYCQSLNFIAAFLLLILPTEEAAFYSLIHIVEDLCPGYYAESLQGLLVDFEVLDDLINTIQPALHQHMQDIHVVPNMIFAAPMMSLLIGHLPTITALRFLDVFLLYGRQALLGALLVIISRCETTLRQMTNVVAFHDTIKREMQRAWNSFTFMVELQRIVEIISDTFNTLDARHSATIREDMFTEARIKGLAQFNSCTPDELCHSSSNDDSDYTKRFNQIFDLFFSRSSGSVVEQSHIDKVSFSKLLCILFPDIYADDTISSYYAALDFNEDKELSFKEFLCAVIFLEPQSRVPPLKKLHMAFNNFNQFKVKAVHKSCIVLLFAWLSRVTFVLRDHFGVKSFYDRKVFKTEHKSKHAKVRTKSELHVLTELLLGPNKQFTLKDFVQQVKRVPVFAAAYFPSSSSPVRHVPDRGRIIRRSRSSKAILKATAVKLLFGESLGNLEPLAASSPALRSQKKPLAVTDKKVHPTTKALSEHVATVARQSRTRHKIVKKVPPPVSRKNKPVLSRIF